MKDKFRYFLSLTILGAVGVPVMVWNYINAGWSALSSIVVLVNSSLLIVGLVGLIVLKKKKSAKHER
ncbi:hypothetical protein [Cytobacillus purgationiresistens]|uniref:Uncharacterized protein n=1 Tax=Cytobacillus purgationiresistens TaxID=863449 RepID=A0ABU0ANS3_9BACI|nr:hypothetical protein [Cytobacillus purgationiresistens]MDQ0272912.1 hypothetical protein [Cytobacillus purgationiresistens]